ncbi:hypothetical protein J1614_001252 [Plenodomus biglobosus]|nr:hypothetical protein J1614_001252 [Plenodomus biglobosus]
MSLLSIISFILYAASAVLAGFDPGSKTNLAVYWGQNSASRPDSQMRLSEHCTGPNVNILIISFLVAMQGVNGQPVLNLASEGLQCNTTIQPMTCPQVEDDIKFCQSRGKTILLSLGGDQGLGFNYTDQASAKGGAQKLWQMFGPPQPNSDVVRPFGSAVIDGFDFDIEGDFANLVAFANEMHDLMKSPTNGEKQYYLAAAPICARSLGSGTSTIQSLLSQTPLDMIFVQFYNGAGTSGCDIRGTFNFDQWNDFAESKNATFFVGLPANETAAPSGGYVVPEKLKEVFGKTKTLEKMGGAMLWDASQAWNNDMYHWKVKEALNSTVIARRH